MTSIRTSSCTWTTYSSFRTHWKNTSPTFVSFYNDFWRTVSLPKRKNVSFIAPQFSFLGFVISRGKLEMDSAKTDAVSSWPIPTSRTELQRFLGFANFYRRFIRNFSSIVSPLTQLTSIKRPFHWSRPRPNQHSKPSKIDSLQPLFSSCRTPGRAIRCGRRRLGTPELEPFYRRGPLTGRFNPCAYFSCRLSPAERNLCHRWRPGTTRAEDGPRRMASPPRRFYGSFPGLDQPQEPGVSAHRQTTQPSHQACWPLFF